MTKLATTDSTAGPRLVDWAAHGVSLFISAVFLDSLRFKFANAPKTQLIFGELDRWAAGRDAPGLFAPTGLFSQYVIGVAELVASILLIAAIFIPRLRFLRPLGALLGLAVMSGAVGFHLFTPLGINVDGDGGALFYTACATWLGAFGLLVLRGSERRDLMRRLGLLFGPSGR